ncbi:MAG TPA: bifunctional YncE family protein/alkaline phosphatase family protein [Bacteroidales bacterium]|nr:bifunctional YncE family protein/alkaline phosphatase family protein [Bacteroidales bacterium]
MNKINILPSLLILILLSGCLGDKQNMRIIRKVGIQPDSSILVPSNQLLRPAGFQVNLPGRPVDLALTQNGRFLLVKNKADLDMIRISDRTVIQSLPFGTNGASFTGICLSPDGKRVYLTDARNQVCIAEIDKNNIMQWSKPVVLPAPDIGGSPAPGGLTLNEKGDRIFVTLSRNNSIAVVNLSNRSVKEIAVGIAPYDVICASPSKAYVTNWGGRRPDVEESTYNTSGSQVLVDGETGIANNGTVSVVDLIHDQQVKEIEVGLHPSGMALSPDRSKLYVACSNIDIISVIDTGTDEVVESISVHRKEGTLFGSSPNDLTISPDGKFLYVANGTENAVCVINTNNPAKIEGYIPTGWYPGSVILNKTGDMLYVANIKGTGSRNQLTNRKGFNSHDHLGSISIIPVPGSDKLEEMTATVDFNNSWAAGEKDKAKVSGKEKRVPVPELPDQTSLFKHVIYIIKENRTYDQVFGDIPCGDGDTSLVEFGYEVTPNHHKLAETFVLLDNFYCSGVLSADGHQWTDEAFVTDYLEKSFGGFSRSYPYDGDDALAYASSGFIWDNVLKHELTFRDYGEFVNAVIEPEDATFMEIYQDFLEGSGKIKIEAKANLEQIDPYLCRTFTGFPNTIPDVYRAAEFIKELKEFEKNGNFPNFIIMLLPNDHTSGTRPGMPTPRASVADNDLALGRIVEAISESIFWKETCILVTEDDPQAGLDHVDGHRTVGMVISPYTKRGEVISTYYSQINMVRTIEDILGIPPMNQLDLSAGPMTDCFTGKADFTPFKAVPNNIPLDEINPPLGSLSGDQLYWAKRSMEQDLDDVDRIDEDTFNRIIWHAVKGYDRPYPDNRK